MRLIKDGLVVLSLLVFFTTLGTWQVFRYHWKCALVETYDQIFQNPCVSFESFKPTVSNLRWPIPYDRCVKLVGHFLPNTQMVLRAKTAPDNPELRKWLRQNKQVPIGDRLMQLFLTQNNQSFWVDRGWVPANWQALDTPAKDTVLEVVFHPFEPPNTSFPLFEKPKTHSQLVYRDLDLFNDLSHQTGNTLFYAEKIMQNQQDVKMQLPYALQKAPPMRNQHLTYAIIWYSLGGCSLIVYIIRRRQR